MNRRSSTVLLTHLVFGILLGLIISGAILLLGHTLFTFDEPSILYALIIIVPISSGVFLLGVGIYQVILEKRETDHFFSYLGDGYEESVQGIARSIDRRRQIRIMSADFPKHRHFEKLGPIEQIILENHVYGEPENADEKISNVSLVARIVKIVEQPLVVHFMGLPLELTQQRDERIPLPYAYILLIAEKADGIYLFRFTKEGDYAGDTWHQSIFDAQRQARYEYQVQAIDWHPIPQNVTDALLFVLSQ